MKKGRVGMALMGSGGMRHLKSGESTRTTAFGQRKVIPRVCIADSKRHLRTFLADVLEDLGFITCECAKTSELATILNEQLPDLIVLGVSFDGIEVAKFLEILAEHAFAGSVLAIGPRESIMVRAVREVGEEYGIAMLPPLLPPFSAETLRAAIASLLPIEPAPSPAVDVACSLKAGWLELWYQHKIDARTLTRCGAEALVRMRHPSWGVVSPASFIPDDGDPHFRRLSEFAIGRAIEDWHYLLERQGPVDLSINLPVSFLKDGRAVHDLCRWMPSHPAFGGLIIAIDGSAVMANLELVVDVAKEVRLHNIAVAIDNLGADWPALLDLDGFPFVELNVDRQFIAGCADHRLKQTVCRRIVELARGYGARTLARGVETRADFLAANAMGFDLVQGHLFGKPMEIKKFARSAAAHAFRLSN
jgi:EAL domain-containing protein (putative c-di-GMP-specific phosphodiesterase class I)